MHLLQYRETQVCRLDSLLFYFVCKIEIFVPHHPLSTIRQPQHPFLGFTTSICDVYLIEGELKMCGVLKQLTVVRQ